MAFAPTSKSRLRTTALVVLGALLASLTGCYNTYQVPADEFRKLQSATALREDNRLAKLAEDGKITPDEMTKLQTRGEKDTVTVTSDRNELVGVNTDTKLFVRSSGGRRYQITPFNFSMVSSQLVASDRDTLLPLAELAGFEVDHLSTPKTVGAISVAVLGATGLIVALFLVSGEKTATGGQ